VDFELNVVACSLRGQELSVASIYDVVIGIIDRRYPKRWCSLGRFSLTASAPSRLRFQANNKTAHHSVPDGPRVAENDR
jgi:hypothetical protein